MIIDQQILVELKRPLLFIFVERFKQENKESIYPIRTTSKQQKQIQYIAFRVQQKVNQYYFFYKNQIKLTIKKDIKLFMNNIQLDHLPRGFVTPEGLYQLKQYKYKSGKYTWMDNKLNPFWEWCVSLVPMWVAPNLITLVGWLFVIASYVNMLLYDYTFTKDIPSYCFFFASFCSFIYSTLDAIDGKQARRTKSSSPLGQLFDHGCDSFSLTFFVLGICQAAKLQSSQVFVIFTTCMAMFWTSNWRQYNTGVLQTNIGQFGVTQAQYLVTIMHLITGVFGQDVWQITFGSLMPSSLSKSYNSFAQLKVGTFIAFSFGIVFFIMITYNILRTVYETKKFNSFGEYFTLAILLLICFVWFNLGLYQQYTGLILINFGIVESLLICKMIISSVTKMPLQYFHAEIIPSIIGTILMIGLDLRQNIQGQIFVFWGLFTVNLLIIIRFLLNTINQITKFLGIYCFTINKNTQDFKKSL